LNLKSLIATAIIGLLVGIAGAVILKQYLHPMTAQVASIQLTRTINGTILADDESINWGIVEPNSNTTLGDLTVSNNGTAPCNVTLSHDAPIGWIITWTANNTYLLPSQNCTAPLELYVPANATQGMLYEWKCYIRAVEP